MNRLKRDKQVAIVSALSEGVSIRSVERMTGVHRDTIMRLGVRVGQACAKLLDETMRDLPCRHVQCDEQWTFVGKKQGRLEPEDDRDARGDFWIWSGLDHDSRAVVSYRLGKRTKVDAIEFMADLAGRMRNRIQLSTDGLNTYIEAAERAFGGQVDFGVVVKSYSAELVGPGRYGPPRVSSVHRTGVVGRPKGISTSHIERQHLSNRMRCRRLTRLVDSFSKKRENLEAAVGLTYAVHNLVRRHGAHKLTPAQALGVQRDPLTIADLVEHAEGSN